MTDVSTDPAPPAVGSLNTSMAWVSMREGLVQLDNGTQGVRTIGVVASRETEPAAYVSVKDLPGFYTRKTKADGTPRTVYLSITDKMTAAKFNAGLTVSVDGQATGFVSAIAAVPEILHPNTNYYAHFYEITGTTGAAVEKLKFTTENFPATYPIARGIYSSFHNQITAGSSSPVMEYKSTESYLIPFRSHYFLAGGGPYAVAFDTISLTPYDLTATSVHMRPFGTLSPPILFYDLYNITPSGPSTSVALWDGMIKSTGFGWSLVIDHHLGGTGTGSSFTFYDNKKAVVVTE
ncbi:hypothetical protein P0082_09005 [Candidatus Haliotispira prima]|uniref:Uncharacterized protein n=1 Tax=Candidatus Haliotispira prima TaxID=3034016 RepID=A0ABY8MF49_9SPIO|nr:hypothetical protein P0082_09005 [Candidatus Haliotispira prima]